MGYEESNAEGVEEGIEEGNGGKIDVEDVKKYKKEHEEKEFEEEQTEEKKKEYEKSIKVLEPKIKVIGEVKEEPKDLRGASTLFVLDNSKDWVDLTPPSTGPVRTLGSARPASQVIENTVSEGVSNAAPRTGREGSGGGEFLYSTGMGVGGASGGGGGLGGGDIRKDYRTSESLNSSPILRSGQSPQQQTNFSSFVDPRTFSGNRGIDSGASLREQMPSQEEERRYAAGDPRDRGRKR